MASSESGDVRVANLKWLPRLSVENAMAEEEQPNSGPRPLRPLVRFARSAVAAPARGVGVIIDEALAAERRARAALEATTGRLASGALDGLLTQLFSDEFVDRVLEHVESAALAQRVVDRLLDDGIVEQISDRVIEGPELEHVVSTALDSDQVQNALARAVDSEGVERLLRRLIASPGSERIVALVLDSPLLTEAITGLLESEELWILVDEIARSPSVTEAISHQGMGFADQVADQLRDRSRGADAWLERTAHRWRRRHGGAAPAANGDVLPDGEAPPPLIGGGDRQ